MCCGRDDGIAGPIPGPRGAARRPSRRRPRATAAPAQRRCTIGTGSGRDPRYHTPCPAAGGGRVGSVRPRGPPAAHCDHETRNARTRAARGGRGRAARRTAPGRSGAAADAASGARSAPGAARALDFLRQMHGAVSPVVRGELRGLQPRCVSGQARMRAQARGLPRRAMFLQIPVIRCQGSTWP